ncbi:uncharacterized protein LOC132273394 [Cornus florida]|uniref:uncharacterized protein LOC132273394 n=1 Tax=Cornus florida TaxID=4283 RepID=UPI00289F1602|nr:uncharacterized protein LOC132273394 [Cornus florida]
MGGLSFKRHPLQGRMEGRIRKLQTERETFLKKTKQTSSSADQTSTSIKCSSDQDVSSSPPPAPISMKRRQFMALVDKVDDEELGVGRRLARRLEGEFERVAAETGLGETKGSPASNDRSKVNLVEEVKHSKSKKLEKGSSKTRGSGGSSVTQCSSFERRQFTARR